MKVAGIILSVLGGVILVGEMGRALTKYNLNSTRDLNRLLFGLGVSAVIIVGGLRLINKAKAKD